MSPRLDLLRPYLSRHKRRFTVLDFGAGINVPAIGTEIAREFDAVVTCVEKDIVTPETSPRTIWLKKEFTVDDLQLMSECEHFDVVIGFNVCHWFGASALKAADILRTMGRYVFLQSPYGDEQKAVETFGPSVSALDRYFKHSEYGWQHIGDTVQFAEHPARPVWMMQNSAVRILTRTSIVAHPDSADTAIVANDTECRAALKKDKDFRDWIPGINLANFLAWNGVWPRKTDIAQMLVNYPIPATRHGDITPHNFVLDGERVYLIDGHESWGGDDRENLQLTIQKVLET